MESLSTIVAALDDFFEVAESGADPAFSRFFPGAYEAAPLSWRIETFSPGFHTDEGVHPGSLITDVKNVYGRVAKVHKSEIESREYITFERQPAYLTFRLDYTGIFSDGASVATAVDPKGTIHSIAISAAKGQVQN